jgi:MATE family multidrug resistance protein
MAMGVTGTILAGHIGVRALAVLALSNSVFSAVLIAGMGVLMGLDPHVARAIGAKDFRRAGRLLGQAPWLVLLAGLPLLGALALGPTALAAMGQDPTVLPEVGEYLQALGWGLLPALWFYAYRAFLAAADRPGVVLAASVVANVVNVGFGLWFIYGGLGLPPQGVQGVAWAATASRLVLLAFVAGWVRWDPRLSGHRHPFEWPTWALVWPLLRTGLPIGVHTGVEVTAFALVTLLMGLVSADAVAAHQVALTVASVTFQVPLAIGAAAAVRVGQALGRRDETAVVRAGWTALAVGLAFGVTSAGAMYALRDSIAQANLPSAGPELLALAAQLLTIGAAFQIMDGAQAIGFGALRGLDDTRVPVLFNVLGFVLLGIPAGYAGTFLWGGGPGWLWWGLCVGLGVVAVLLWGRFAVMLRRRRIAASAAAAPRASLAGSSG